MHTKAFNAVIEKIKSGGRERLDGFLSSEFAGVNAAEYSELVGIFVRDNDFQALSVLLPEAEFLEFVRDSVYSLDRCSDDYINALIWANKLSVTDDALENLVACIGGLSTWSASSALSFLSEVNVPDEVADSYIKVLSDLLSKKNIDSAVALKASAELLRLKMFKPRSPEYIEFASRLLAKDRRVRERALAELAANG